MKIARILAAVAFAASALHASGQANVEAAKK